MHTPKNTTPLARRPWFLLLIVALTLSAWPARAAQAQGPAVWYKTPKTLDDLRRLEVAVLHAVKKARPASIGLLMGGSMGSGTLISADGWIATAAHVTDRINKKCKVSFGNSGKPNASATTKGRGTRDDFALVKIDNAAGLPFVEMADSSKVRVGQWVINMGQPLGTEPGRPPVVRVGRIWAIRGRKFVCDGPLISGDSGGPMFDLAGRLIAINVSINAADPSLNNSTPINFVRDNYEALKRAENVQKGRGGRNGPQQPNDINKAITSAYQLLDTAEKSGKEEDFEKAEKAFLAAIDIDPLLGDGYYHLACAYNRWAVILSGRARTKKLQQSFAALGDAVDKGWDNLDHMKTDKDMNLIRGAAEFKAVTKRIADGKLPRITVLGATVRTMEAADRPRRFPSDAKGAVVIETVAPGSPAAEAKLKPGYFILAWDENQVTDDAGFMVMVQRSRPGSTHTLRYLSKSGGTRPRKKNVTLTGRLAPELRRRDRLPADEKRAGAKLRAAYVDAIKRYRQSVVEVRAGGRVKCLGAVVSREGHILTKASEITGASGLVVRFASGKSLPATVVATDTTFDLAVIKVTAAGLTPIEFSDVDPNNPFPGTFLATVGLGKEPIAIGFAGVVRYDSKGGGSSSSSGGGKPFFGVNGANANARELSGTPHRQGAKLTNVQPDGAAGKAGLRTGDILVEIDGKPIAGWQGLIAVIRASKVGQQLAVTYVRNGEVRKTTVSVGARPAQGSSGSSRRRSPKMQTIMGPHNNRDTRFGEVIHHDSVLKPTQVGGPLVDLHGRVLGLNIARNDRTKSFAIPSYVLRKVVPALIAARPLPAVARPATTKGLPLPKLPDFANEPAAAEATPSAGNGGGTPSGAVALFRDIFREAVKDSRYHPALKQATLDDAASYLSQIERSRVLSRLGRRLRKSRNAAEKRMLEQIKRALR